MDELDFKTVATKQENINFSIEIILTTQLNITITEYKIKNSFLLSTAVK